MGDRRATLLYRGTCRKCRVLSMLAVILAGGGLRRLALGSVAAERLHELYPDSRGKLALVDGGRVLTGAAVVVGLVVTLPRSWSRGAARVTAAGRGRRRAP